MAHELRTVGTTPNTDYSKVEPEILMEAPEPGHEDNGESARLKVQRQQAFARDAERKRGAVVMDNRVPRMQNLERKWAFP